MPFQHKYRSKILKHICTKESDTSCAALDVELAVRKERILGLTGWCGGNILNPASRLGNVRQLKSLLTAIEGLAPERRFAVLNTRNRDGYTPLMIARSFRQRSAVDLLSEAGAGEDPFDYFGRPISD